MIFSRHTALLTKTLVVLCAVLIGQGGDGVLATSGRGLEQHDRHVSMLLEQTATCNGMINYVNDYYYNPSGAIAHIQERFPKCEIRNAIDFYQNAYSSEKKYDKSGHFVDIYDFEVLAPGDWYFSLEYDPPNIPQHNRHDYLEMALYIDSFSLSSPCANFIPHTLLQQQGNGPNYKYSLSETGSYSLVVSSSSRDYYSAFYYAEMLGEENWHEAYKYRLRVEAQPWESFSCSTRDSFDYYHCPEPRRLTPEHQLECTPGGARYNYHAFEFSVTSASVWEFSLCGSPPNSDTLLYLYDDFWSLDCPCSGWLASDDDSCNPGTGSGARLSAVLSPGCYTLVVRAFGPGDEPVYRLSVAVPVGEQWSGPNCGVICPPAPLFECASVLSSFGLGGASESTQVDGSGARSGFDQIAAARATVAQMQAADLTIVSELLSFDECATRIAYPIINQCASSFAFDVPALGLEDCFPNERELEIHARLCNTNQSGVVFISYKYVIGGPWEPAIPILVSPGQSTISHVIDLLEQTVVEVSIYSESSVQMQCASIAYRCIGAQCPAPLCTGATATPSPTPTPTPTPTPVVIHPCKWFLCNLGTPSTNVWGTVSLDTLAGTVVAPEVRVEIRGRCGSPPCTPHQNRLLDAERTTPGGFYRLCVSEAEVNEFSGQFRVTVVSTDANEDAEQPSWSNYVVRVFDSQSQAVVRHGMDISVGMNCAANQADIVVPDTVAEYFSITSELAYYQRSHAADYPERQIRSAMYQTDVWYPSAYCQNASCMQWSPRRLHIIGRHGLDGGVISHEFMHHMYAVDGGNGFSQMLNEAMAYFHQDHKADHIGYMFRGTYWNFEGRQGRADLYKAWELVTPIGPPTSGPGTPTVPVPTAWPQVYQEEAAAYLWDVNDDTPGEALWAIEPTPTGTPTPGSGGLSPCGEDLVDRHYKEIYERAISALDLTEFVTLTTDQLAFDPVLELSHKRIARHHGMVDPAIHYSDACSGYLPLCVTGNCPAQPNLDAAAESAQ